MTFWERFYSFFSNNFRFFRKKEIPALELTEEIEQDSFLPEKQEDDCKKEILEKRNLTTILYVLEQEIKSFKYDFEKEYEGFFLRIENLRQRYDCILNESNKKLTFEVNPEDNLELSFTISKLEKDIRRFIDKEVRFKILSKRFQTLIVKLNTLYNSSILYPNQSEKVMSQSEGAIKKEFELVEEFKENEYIFLDKQLKEDVVILISYADYELFKIVLRNSERTPNEVLSNLALAKQFDKFDYIFAFSSFFKDELANLSELLDCIDNKNYRNIFENQINELCKRVTINADLSEILMSRQFWDEVFELESSLINFLKNKNSCNKINPEIRIIDWLNIDISKNEVLTSAKTNTYLTLTKIYSKTFDDRIFLLIKLFENINDEISYKAIYYILLLFGCIEIVQNNSNNLNIYLKKYEDKYSYSNSELEKKKNLLLNSRETYSYVEAITLDENFENFINILKKLNIDFCFENNKIYINSFYFQGLDNVFSNENYCYLNKTNL